jgi:hypothetical protein
MSRADILGQVRYYLSLPNLRPDNDYFVIRIKGDCMSTSKEKINDGDYLLCHEIPATLDSLDYHLGEVVCFRQRSGLIMTKKVFMIQQLTRTVFFKQFNPSYIFPMQIEEITNVFLVDEVLNPDFIEAHKIEWEKLPTFIDKKAVKHTR